MNDHDVGWEHDRALDRAWDRHCDEREAREPEEHCGCCGALDHDCDCREEQRQHHRDAEDA